MLPKTSELTLWLQSGVVHALETEPSGHEWTKCRAYLTRTPECDYYESRRSIDPVTCLFCLTGSARR